MLNSWQMMEPYWDEIIASDPADYAATIAAAPQPIVDMVTSSLLDREVCNGGFWQFFWNSSGLVVLEAVAGFRAIGCPELADIAEEAIARMPAPYSKGRAPRQAYLDGLETATGPDAEHEDWDPFVDLDERYFAAVGGSSEGATGFADLIELYAYRAQQAAGR